MIRVLKLHTLMLADDRNRRRAALSALWGMYWKSVKVNSHMIADANGVTDVRVRDKENHKRSQLAVLVHLRERISSRLDGMLRGLMEENNWVWFAHGDLVRVARENNLRMLGTCSSSVRKKFVDPPLELFEEALRVFLEVDLDSVNLQKYAQEKEESVGMEVKSSPSKAPQCCDFLLPAKDSRHRAVRALFDVLRSDGVSCPFFKRQKTRNAALKLWARMSTRVHDESHLFDAWVVAVSGKSGVLDSSNGPSFIDAQQSQSAPSASKSDNLARQPAIEKKTPFPAAGVLPTSFPSLPTLSRSTDRATLVKHIADGVVSKSIVRPLDQPPLIQNDESWPATAHLDGRYDRACEVLNFFVVQGLKEKQTSSLLFKASWETFQRVVGAATVVVEAAKDVVAAAQQERPANARPGAPDGDRGDADQDEVWDSAEEWVWDEDAPELH